LKERLFLHSFDAHDKAQFFPPAMLEARADDEETETDEDDDRIRDE
jgi:hypothetical protein